jgi:hypothetical protein
MRSGAVFLGLSGQVFLSLLDNTANDALAAIPLVWAVALALNAMTGERGPAHLSPAAAVRWSGLLAGVSVAFKFSNGPLAILMPLLWVLCGPGLRTRFVQVVRGSAWTLAGFAAAYGYWGWQLCRNLGNPLYPFFPDLSRTLQALAGWSPC